MTCRNPRVMNVPMHTASEMSQMNLGRASREASCIPARPFSLCQISRLKLVSTHQHSYQSPAFALGKLGRASRRDQSPVISSRLQLASVSLFSTLSEELQLTVPPSLQHL